MTKKSKGIPPIVIQTKEPGRNEPCPCRSGRKYKHCCLIEKIRKERKAMSEEKKQPTVEEAIKWLQGYTKQRMMSHNVTVQMLFNAVSALKQLPTSPDRDLCITDFERRLNEFVGEGAGKDAQVTFALSRLMSVYEQKETATPAKTPDGDGAKQEVAAAEKSKVAGPVLVKDENKPVEAAAPAADEVKDEVMDIIEEDDKTADAPAVSEDEKEAALAEQEIEQEEAVEQQNEQERVKDDDVAAEDLGSEV